MEKEFVPYELAVKLKALGFDKECFSYYDLNNKPNFFGADGLMDTHCVQVNRPTFSQAFRWFREKYHIHGEPFYKGGLTKQTSWYDYKIYSTIDWINTNPKQQWKTYEEAELACLEKLIEILELKSE